ncbi:MAG: phage tail tip lysozyme [Pseudomonadota bacterium]
MNELPLIDIGPETDDLDLFGAQFDQATAERNYMWMHQRRTESRVMDELGSLSAAMFGDPEKWKEDLYTPPDTPLAAARNPLDAAEQRMFEMLDRVRSNNPGAGEFANFPMDRDDLRFRAAAAASKEIADEKADAEGRIASRSDPNVLGGMASFAGDAAAAVTDIEGVMTLPLGAGAGSLARTMLINSFIGGFSEAITIPAYQRQAERLGTNAPDPVMQVLMGATFGAALPLAGRAVRLGANALTPAGRVTNRELLGFARAADATDEQRGAAHVLARDEAARDTALPGSNHDAHVANIDAAERALLNDTPEMVRVDDVVPRMDGADAPAARATPGTPPVFDYAAGGNAARDANQVGYVFGKLVDQGYDAPQTAAILGNLMVESGKGLNTGAIGDNGNANGMAQWNGPRRRALHRFAEARGVDWRDIDLQVEFLHREMQGPGWTNAETKAAFFAATDAAEAARIASEHFWRPGVPHLSSRMAYARMVASQYEGGQVPKGGAPGKWRNPGDDALASGVVSFNPRDLLTDANAYQYKLGGDRYGVTDRLQSEREWDARAAVGVIVHERLDGIRYIADGHQRLGLANRLLNRGGDGIELQGFLMREADGWTVEQVRATAALKNIRSESGTPLDAAKLLRDSPELASQISRSRPFMAQAQGLSDLAPGPFQAVVNEVIPQNFGAIVGRVIPDDDRLQGVAIATLAKARPANETQAESIIRDIRRLGLEKRADDAQLDMFGAGFNLRDTVISERAQVIDRVIKDARADRALFSRLEKQAETIQEAGNVLDREANLSRAELAEQALARVLILADQPGPVRDAIDAAAKALRSGTRIDAAANAVFDALGRSADARAGGAAADGAGGGGAAPASLDPPRLTDLPAEGEARMQRGLFDDPVDDVAETRRLDTLERQMTVRLADPAFDLALPLTAAPDGPSQSLRALVADLNEEADFVDALKTICMPKGS